MREKTINAPMVISIPSARGVNIFTFTNFTCASNKIGATLYLRPCPGFSNHRVHCNRVQFSNVIPQMRDGLQRLIPGPNAAVKAATAIRVAFSHYMIRSDDADEFLAQLRHAVGIKAPG